MIEPQLIKSLQRFQIESNRIEGIVDASTKEVSALQKFVDADALSIDGLKAYVSTCQPDARLRDAPGVPGVRVGDHIAPPSGPQVAHDLANLLTAVMNHAISPHAAHLAYETLHPFTDGNGRSGRALWLWMMFRGSDLDRRQALELGFLHTFYYQTLAPHEARR